MSLRGSSDGRNLTDLLKRIFTATLMQSAAQYVRTVCQAKDPSASASIEKHRIRQNVRVGTYSSFQSVIAARTSCDPPKVIEAVTLKRWVSVSMAWPELRLECTHVQFPTSPSHPLTYEAKALYFGVESIAAQSTCITARED